jgi:signal transduction histidine kinase
VTTLFNFPENGSMNFFNPQITSTLVFEDQGSMAMTRNVVLQNLINSAAKFTEKGKVQVTACHHAGRREIEFIVADTGIGIAQEQIPMIFEKFWHVDAAHIKDHGGMGLGLCIVDAFSELTGGRVMVQSALGEGSEFKLSRPAM